MNQKQTQCKKIVDYIRANGHITSLEAAKHLNTRSYAPESLTWRAGDLFSTSLNSRSATVKTRSPIIQSPGQELSYE